MYHTCHKCDGRGGFGGWFSHKRICEECRGTGRMQPPSHVRPVLPSPPPKQPLQIEIKIIHEVASIIDTKKYGAE